MRNKRGQFYLVAAIILVFLISGMTSVTTYAVLKPKPKTLYSMSSELKEESIRIIDYGIYNTIDINQTLSDFTDEKFGPYFLKKTGNSNVVFLYGNATDVYSVQYNETDTGLISATLGGATTKWEMTVDYANRTEVECVAPCSIVTVQLWGKEYEFELKENEMFYFVMTQEREGEIFVEKN